MDKITDVYLESNTTIDMYNDNPEISRFSLGIRSKISVFQNFFPKIADFFPLEYFLPLSQGKTDKISTIRTALLASIRFFPRKCFLPPETSQTVPRKSTR